MRLSPARGSWRGVTDPVERFKAYFGLWYGHWARGEPEPMRELAQLFLAEAEGRREAAVAHRIAGQTAWYLGDYHAVHEHQQRAIALYDRTRDGDFAARFGHDPLAMAESYDALALWALGQVEEASRLAERALADAEAIGHVPTTMVVRANRGLLGLHRRDPQAVAAEAAVMGGMLSRYDLNPLFAGDVTFKRGWVAWRRGGGPSALADMRQGIAFGDAAGYLTYQPIRIAALAQAEADAGESAVGLQRLDYALAELQRTDLRWYEAEMHRIRGEILLKRDPADTAAAEQSLQTAIAIAQSQKARSFELRAALSLAKLYRAANRDPDAHAVLAPAIEGFPPTRQFREFAEAQALLSVLSP